MMRTVMLALVSILAGYGIYAFAQGRVSVQQPLTPIASSSSNDLSYAWFYDGDARAVYVCRASSSTVDCARGTLP